MSNLSTTSQNENSDVDVDVDSQFNGELPPELSQSASTPGSELKDSVLKQVSQRTSAKSRRRKAPAWAIRISQTGRDIKQFFLITLPEFLKRHRRELTTAGVSFFVHLLFALSLAAWFLPDTAQDDVLKLIGASPEDVEQIQPDELIEIVQPEKIENLDVNSTMQQMLAELEKGPHRLQMDSPEDRELTLPLDDLVDISDTLVMKGDFGGRSDAGRRAAVAAYGGNADSEKAVSDGLIWLQKIQQEDGSWSFIETGGAGQPGNLSTTDMGATSLALLCFLGSGNTHKAQGQYQETVQKGLAYLMKNADRGAGGADLRGRAQGNSGMYVQGIATICVCEASAMEPSDRELRRLAGDAVKFIERSQDPGGGGWRYSPGDAGDTSVVGWQVMALQSAKSGRIKVLGSTLQDVRKFLDSVEVEKGAKYAYMPGSQDRDSMTAVGLLCRMYLGWSRTRPQLKAGVEYLAKKGPKRGDIYFNYYATQVLHHWGGEEWKQWNLKMRNELVSTQVKDGPGAGSWDVTDPHGYAGGRLYQTTLSLLTLEVYYRHLPIYRRFDEKTADSEANADQK